MDKLTPQLNEQQLKGNIDALVKQGAPKETVQGYINNYSKDLNGNYVLKTQKPAVVAGKQLLGSFKDRGEEQKQIIDTAAQDIQEGTDKGGIGGAAQALRGVGEAGLNTVGNVAKGVGDIFGAAIKLFPKLDTAIQQGGQAFLDGTNILGEKNSETIAKINKVAESHPHLSKDLSSIVNILTLGAGGAAEQPLKAGAKSAAKDLLEAGSSVKNKAIATATKNATEKEFNQVVKDVMPLPSKEVKIDALRNALPEATDGTGGVARKGALGKSTIQAAPEDIERAKVVQPYLKGAKDPVKQIQNVNQGIKTESEARFQFLDKNPVDTNFEDLHNYMQKNTPSVNLQKDTGAFESYSRATTDALDTLNETMRSTAKETGDFSAKTSVADIEKARIAIDKKITSQLGEEAFGTPQYRGIKAAEIDTRNLLNRMSEDLLRYPGQLDKVNRLNDFVSASKARGIEVDLANPEVLKGLEEKFGLLKTAESEANAQQLIAQHKKMSHLFDARDNMIDKYQSSVGKNKVQEFMKKNPAVKKATNAVGSVLKVGAGVDLMGGI